MKRRFVNRITIGIAAVAAFVLPAVAATETVLYSFTDSGTGYPNGTLYFANGSLYGTGSGDEKSADGQVFELTNRAGSWKEKTLVTFDGANGSMPFAGPIRGADGVFYGTTAYGDAFNGGNVYALSRKGGKWVGLTVWAFGGTSGDGIQPTCDLVIDKSGNLYGTTYGGGAYNLGTVFELSKANGVWTETVLHSFVGNGDGGEPYAGLTLARSEIFYGTTQYGGNYGNGAIFRLFRSGGVWKERVLYSFTGGSDGSEPLGRLIGDKNGALYGTTYAGGGNDAGVVFVLSRSAGKWTETVLHSFDPFNGDGENPFAGLTWGPSGSLYGTTALGAGTVFQLVNSGGVWNETILHKFGKGDGISPHGGVTLDKNGVLYGATEIGGTNNLGTVWTIMP